MKESLEDLFAEVQIDGPADKARCPHCSRHFQIRPSKDFMMFGFKSIQCLSMNGALKILGMNNFDTMPNGPMAVSEWLIDWVGRYQKETK